MPPKIDKELLIDSVLEPRVIESITQAIAPIVAATVEKCLSEKLSSFLKDLELVKAESQRALEVATNTATELGTISDSISEIKSELESVKRINSTLQHQINELNTYSRRDNLMFYGLKVTSYADAASVTRDNSNTAVPVDLRENNSRLVQEILNICNNTLNVPITTSDISVAHRVGSSSSASNSSQSSPPIVVRFTSRRARDNVFAARKKLKDSNLPGLYINEHLSTDMAKIFKQARDLIKSKKIHSAWSHNGIVFFKVSSDGVAVRTTSMNSLPI